jgi:D-alanyl-D-alanine carboxypeptidase (penicillin-binding protein 5/6)
LAYGFNNFERVKLIEKGTVYETVEVKDAKDDPVLNLVTDGDVFYTLPVNVDRSSVKEVLQLNDDISAPVNEGDLIGTVDVQIDGESIGNVRLLAERYVEMKAQAVVKNSLLNFLHSDLFSKVFSGLVILIIAFLLLRFTLRRVSRRVNSRKY